MTSFPHTRGDGPTTGSGFTPDKVFSPHPWGWTDELQGFFDTEIVFPTPVGMDRGGTSGGTSLHGFPHTRGDGPYSDALLLEFSWFSPHPWGWTGASGCLFDWLAVFPTPVGMDRCGKFRGSSPRSFPHTRGDGPTLAAGTRLYWEFSPHPWGWTGDAG